MKTALLLFTSVAVFTIGAKAQITLNQSSYTGATFQTTDTVGVVIGTSGIPTNLGGGNNVNWDFSTVNYNTSEEMLYMAAPSGYDFQLFKIDTISSPFLYINSRGYYNIAANGYMQSVLRIDRRGYTLSGKVIGAVATDSIVFDNQLDTLSNPLTLIKFPATMSTSWSSNYVTDIKFHVTYALASINNAPGNNYRYETETDSVIGWGKMTVKRADASKSGTMDVLEVRVHHIRTDSFYLNGAPAPPSLFQPPFVTQGAVTHTYMHRFYRAGQVTPLVEVTYTDNTYATASKTTVDWSPTPASIKHIPGSKAVIYPNPVTGNVIHIELAEQFKTSIGYKLTNLAGQTILSGNLPANQLSHKITTPATLAAGSYLLCLEQDGTQIAAKQLVIK
jgi:hypothetical protein